MGEGGGRGEGGDGWVAGEGEEIRRRGMREEGKGWGGGTQERTLTHIRPRDLTLGGGGGPTVEADISRPPQLILFL